jgi:hypothetical protein
METIRESRVAPLRKARLLLKLGKKLDAQAQSLTQAKAQTARTSDRTASAGLSRMAVRSQLLHEDVREAAVMALKPDPAFKLKSN